MAEDQCPYCRNSLELGHIVGNVTDSIAAKVYGFTLQWYEGDPSWQKSLLQLGDPVGATGVFEGSYALGKRCTNCRKIILDY